MKVIRKILAILLLTFFVLLLPVVLVVKNSEKPALSVDIISGLIEEQKLIPDVADKVQTNIQDAVQGVDAESDLMVVDAWDSLGEGAWAEMTDEFGVQDFVASSARQTAADILAWFEADAGTPPPVINLREFKDTLASKDSFVTETLLGNQAACTPEQMEMYYPQSLVIVEVKDNLNIAQTNTTVYQLTYTNPNLVTEIQLDDFVLPGIGDLQLRSFYTTPGCIAFVGEVVKPGEEVVCKFDWENNKLEEINETLTFSTTRIEPDMDYVICKPSEDKYDEYAAELVNPITQMILARGADQFSDELTLDDSLTEEVHQYVKQGRQAAQFGWIAVAAILVIAVLLGAGFTRYVIGWAGWPLLLAGGLTLGVGYAFQYARDTIWAQVTPYFGTGISESTMQSFRAVFDKVLPAVTQPTLIQGGIILGVGLALVILSFVFRKKKTKEQDNQPKE